MNQEIIEIESLDLAAWLHNRGFKAASVRLGKNGRGIWGFPYSSEVIAHVKSWSEHIGPSTVVRDFLADRIRLLSSIRDLRELQVRS